MKKNLKKMIKLFILLLCVAASLLLSSNVLAETVLSSFKATYKTIDTPISFPTNFHVIKTTDGKHVFCMQYNLKVPSSDITYTKGSLITDNGLNYILNQAYTAKTDNDHFIYKSALWIYMVDMGLMEGTNNNIKQYKKNVENSNLDVAKQILELVQNAKKASANDTAEPTIKVNNSNVTFTLDSTGKYYVSNAITVTSSTGAYTVTLTEAPKDSTFSKDGNTFTIKVPVSEVTDLTTEISFTVSTSKEVYTSYRYNPSNSAYQPLAATFKETKTANATGSVSINRTVSVPFLKVDAETGEAISGAELKLTDSNGKEVLTWISEKEEKVIDGLLPGKYTLTEVKAPNGYNALKTSIEFTIDSNGKILDSDNKEVEIIKIANEKKTGGVFISKRDITNDKELPGATLQIKDYNGNTKDEWTWVSTNEPHYIEKLEPGIYTLREIYAPNGYILSDEIKTFTIKEDGTVETVVMYNSPASKDDVPVEPTSSFKTMTSTVVGSIVLLVGSFIIIRNSKKKEN